MSIKSRIFVTFLGCVVAFDMYGQATRKLVQRASSQNFCLQVSPSGTPADALCINGTTKVVDAPAGFTINSGTTLNSFVEGSFTPTISSTTNITSTGTVSFHYQRIGNQVHVWGGMDITPTVANTFTTFVMTVPITATSTISDTRAAGTGVEGDSGTTGVAWVIRGGGNTTTVGVQAFARTTGIKNSKFHYTYWVN